MQVCDEKLYEFELEFFLDNFVADVRAVDELDE
jgi:hypothetical protein